MTGRELMSLGFKLQISSSFARLGNSLGIYGHLWTTLTEDRHLKQRPFLYSPKPSTLIYSRDGKSNGEASKSRLPDFRSHNDQPTATGEVGRKSQSSCFPAPTGWSLAYTYPGLGSTLSEYGVPPGTREGASEPGF